MAEVDVICDQCGSVYKVKSIKSPMRDKDSIDCQVCGEKDIYSWNEAKIWTAILIDRKEWTKK